MDDNGWEEWRKYILKKLEENDVSHTETRKTLNEISNKLTVLQTEARVGKFLGTTVLAAVVSFIVSLVSRFLP